MDIQQKTINTIRTLSVDMVQKANSGHPGAPMGMAPMAYAVWADAMSHNPKNPGWHNRDRFVLSNGHASALLYSLLHLFGYGLTMDDLIMKPPVSRISISRASPRNPPPVTYCMTPHGSSPSQLK